MKKSKETTFSGSKTIWSGVVLLLGVDGLCTGGVTQTATQTVWGAYVGIGVKRAGKHFLLKQTEPNGAESTP